jgi:hypothetical protein
MGLPSAKATPHKVRTNEANTAMKNATRNNIPKRSIRIPNASLKFWGLGTRVTQTKFVLKTIFNLDISDITILLIKACIKQYSLLKTLLILEIQKNQGVKFNSMAS